MQSTITLKANKPLRQEFARALNLVLVSTGDALSVDVDIEIQGFATEKLRGLKRGDRVGTPGFQSATFTAQVDCVIEVAATVLDVRINNGDGQTVDAIVSGSPTVTIEGQTVDVSGQLLKVEADSPLPVNIGTPTVSVGGTVALTRGTPGNLLYVSGVSINDAPASGVVDNAAEPVTSAGTAVVGADADRLELRFLNLGPDPVAIGGPAVAWAERSIVLDVGDMWIETRGAALQWDAVTDAAKTASVTVQEVFA